jgi:RNA polymerase sigma-70 factor (ECF subfamily)
MTDEGAERFHRPWWHVLWSREPDGSTTRHGIEEQRFRRDLLLLLPRLRGHALALTGASERADDLVQDTCERALRRWRQYNGEGPLAAWLLRILHNRWRDRLRADAVRAADPLPNDGPALADPPRAQDGAELAQTLCAIARLPADQRAALLLVAVEGMRYREAAEVMAVPVGTVRSRVSRARAALAANLDAGNGLPRSPETRDDHAR